MNNIASMFISNYITQYRPLRVCHMVDYRVRTCCAVVHETHLNSLVFVTRPYRLMPMAVIGKLCDTMVHCPRSILSYSILECISSFLSEGNEPQCQNMGYKRVDVLTLDQRPMKSLLDHRLKVIIIRKKDHGLSVAMNIQF